jgi:PIN domain nuclease of toxin-antitoxin system
MRLLLDTSTFLKWDVGRLNAAATKKVRHAEEIHVSAITSWEIAIKVGVRKLRFDRSVERAIREYGFSELAATVRHGDRVAYLPLHHGDPFDRLLIAQAIEEGLTILTSDRVFELYQVNVEWA